jgi:hypothetical protein
VDLLRGVPEAAAHEARDLLGLRREPDELRRLIRWLHFARNELSHLRERSAHDLARGRSAVERAAAILGSALAG